MKKHFTTGIIAVTLASSMLLTSCLGQFALTNKVLAWNKQVGSKFVNEVVFFAFWILPVYELTGLADLLVINSIEFWSGTNPVVAQRTVEVDGKDARYLVKCDKKGYTITNRSTGEVTKFNYDAMEQSWSVEADGSEVKLFTWVDVNHIDALQPDGSYARVTLDEQGICAYANAVRTGALMAAR